MESGAMFVQTAGACVAGGAREAARLCGVKHGLVSRVGRARGTVVMMGSPTSYEEYMRERNAGMHQGGTMEEARQGLQSFLDGGGDMEFDGGDSGGGVVGDGNVDLEDQHNTTSMVRGGWGRTESTKEKVTGATQSRIASAGANYFGRSTGYAEVKIDQISDEDRKKKRMDEVRAQQLENWHNQRAIFDSNRSRGQGVVFGQPSLDDQSFSTQLAAQKQSMSSAPAERLDGGSWGAAQVVTGDDVIQTFEVRSGIGAADITEFKVKNKFSTFAPFRCAFTPDSHPAFTVSPESGSMNRSTGEPINVVVRFRPMEMMGGATATLVFETEDFKNVYKFIGST
eukprot:CAMPEP_0185857646 /NCGR_PEP_ID=MMETSP1354-20130828/29607_1 /TAXON_ID=708628 /ORGANISM="Erythrolobus madagascarensis, Strain CCMP3276" /LENGTH=339 /DNA_ID=CAMNT_0028559917 /DNA_START=45 /DNA_END=1064 /DNA_ORIENTATION=+